jgi:hypothetical protein
MRVDVYYDPDNPSTGILETGIPPSRLWLLIGLGVGSVVGCIVCILTLRGWLHARREKRKQAAPSSEAAASPIQDPPLDVDEILRQFGEPMDAFRPGISNIIAGMIIGALLVLGGGAALFFMAQVVIEEGGKLPWSREKGHSWLSVLILSGLGLGALIGGLALIFGMRRLLALRILV